VLEGNLVDFGSNIVAANVIPSATGFIINVAGTYLIQWYITPQVTYVLNLPFPAMVAIVPSINGIDQTDGRHQMRLAVSNSPTTYIDYGPMLAGQFIAHMIPLDIIALRNVSQPAVGGDLNFFSAVSGGALASFSIILLD
jgi:hypothetical protein